MQAVQRALRATLLVDVGEALRQVRAVSAKREESLTDCRRYQLDKYKRKIKNADWMIKADKPPEPKAPSGK